MANGYGERLVHVLTGTSDPTGNTLGSWFLDEPCYNLIYLELADCQLTQIPKEIGRVIPNVRVLNLNHNFIGDLDGLGELRRLRKLSVIGSRLRNSREIIKAVRRMGEMEMVDFR
jgi:Leucine-rich repeat (LRR) protein